MRQQVGGAGLLAPTQAALPPFRLCRPKTLDEARRLLLDNPDATLAAGCTDLVAAVREGCSPSTLISLRGIDELRTAEQRAGELHLGGLLTHHDGSRHPAVNRVLPMLGAAWSSIATVRIRFRATVGGNIMARRHRYEMAVILGALETQLLFSGPAGEWRCRVDEFVDGPTAGPALLHHLVVDTESLHTFHYDRSLRPLTTVALAVRRTGGGLRLTAVAGSEYRRPALLRAEIAGDRMTAADRADLAHDMAAQLPERAGDYAGSIEYRRRVVEVLLRRQLTPGPESIS
ncbi:MULTISPECIES: FAD binding domain-containing protein [unclassified Streptomyces]|uniref:FAD binding domain-containing protein n=1 Tax=unclassified Streptomyces TaxID=2593676 RepID=UPI002E222F62|nr:FAD binding domain-containing protein [Streptomyces sp. NBC_01023]